MSKTIKDITATQTTLNSTDYFEIQEDAGTSKKVQFSTIKSGAQSGVVTVYKQDSYVILDTDGYQRIEVDTTSGAVTITLPLKANNIGRRIEIAYVKGGTNDIAISPHATDANKLSNDGLASIVLPKVGDFVILQESANSGFWEVVNERITSQLRLNTYAGYGSTDTKIMRFTNVVENVGNMFSENHVSGYMGNTKGLEITINRSGKYAFTFSKYLNAGQNGISLNSNQLTTQISDITLANILCSVDSAGGLRSTVSITLYVKKGDVIRAHSNGSAPVANPENIFTATYLGN